MSIYEMTQQGSGTTTNTYEAEPGDAPEVEAASVDAPSDESEDTGAAPESAERTYSQDELDEIVKKRLARDRRSRRQKKQPKQEPAAADIPQTEDLMARLERSDRNNELFRCMVDSGVSGQYRKALERLAASEQPDISDMGDWLAETVQQFGFTESHREPQEPEPTPAPPARVASDAGSPSPQNLDPDSLNFDYVNASADDWDRIKAAKGGERSPKYRAWLQQLNSRIKRGDGAVALALPKRGRK